MYEYIYVERFVLVHGWFMKLFNRSSYPLEDLSLFILKLRQCYNIGTSQYHLNTEPPTPSYDLEGMDTWGHCCNGQTHREHNGNYERI